MELLISNSHHPAFNLATEDFLFSRCEGEFAFFYSNDPCVVIGSNQVWRNEVDALFCEENQIPVFRRISGGGAVYTIVET
jgi:lipoate-protein ligase A